MRISYLNTRKLTITQNDIASWHSYNIITKAHRPNFSRIILQKTACVIKAAGGEMQRVDQLHTACPSDSFI